MNTPTARKAKGAALQNRKLLLSYLRSYAIVLVIPFLLSLLFYIFSLNQARQAAIRQNDQVLATAAAQVDIHLQEVESIAREIISNPTVRAYQWKATGFDYPNAYRMIEVRNSLRNYTLTQGFISQYFLLFNDSRIAMSNSFIYTYDDFFKNFLRLPDGEVEAFLERLEARELPVGLQARPAHAPAQPGGKAVSDADRAAGGPGQRLCVHADRRGQHHLVLREHQPGRVGLRLRHERGGRGHRQPDRGALRLRRDPRRGAGALRRRADRLRLHAGPVRQRHAGQPHLRRGQRADLCVRAAPERHIRPGVSHPQHHAGLLRGGAAAGRGPVPATGESRRHAPGGADGGRGLLFRRFRRGPGGRAGHRVGPAGGQRRSAAHRRRAQAAAALLLHRTTAAGQLFPATPRGTGWPGSSFPNTPISTPSGCCFSTSPPGWRTGARPTG